MSIDEDPAVRIADKEEGDKSIGVAALELIYDVVITIDGLLYFPVFVVVFRSFDSLLMFF